MKLRFVLPPLAAALAMAATPLMAQDKRTVLSLETAKKMAAACEAMAKQQGWKMNIAIYDAGANMKYFLRQDADFLGSI